jgi:hypothetical protein
MTHITLEIPLPPRECSQNYHGHWRRVHASVKEYRETCALLFRQAAPGWKARPVRVSAEFFCGPSVEPRYRPLDIGNAIGSLKAAIDGLVDGGMSPSDSHKDVVWGDVRLFRAKKEHQGRACVVLTMEALEEAAANQ